MCGCCQGRPEKTGKLWSEAARLAGADRRANRTLADGASPGIASNQLLPGPGALPPRQGSLTKRPGIVGVAGIKGREKKP